VGIAVHGAMGVWYARRTPHRCGGHRRRLRAAAPELSADGLVEARAVSARDPVVPRPRREEALTELPILFREGDALVEERSTSVREADGWLVDGKTDRVDTAAERAARPMPADARVRRGLELLPGARVKESLRLRALEKALRISAARRRRSQNRRAGG
jgi:hypothetical protein